MRKYYIAGNWKLNPAGDPLPLLREVKMKVTGLRKIDLMIAPPFTGIHQAAEMFKGTGVHISGQSLFWEDKGAFTAEISAPMLKAAGADTVIIGHSERRQYFGETDETVNKRMRAAVSGGIIPVLCIGETLAEREKGVTLDVIKTQLDGGLDGFSEAELENTIIAYEPVWAIGTGKVASPSDAQEVHEFIRRHIRSMYSAAFSDKTRLLYGGSVKPANAQGLFEQVDIDGALIGGASLSAESFAGIAGAASELS